MFNSIRKDDGCRKLVKSFELLRLQNKILVQAMSMSDAFPTQAEKSMLDIALFDNGNTKNKRPLLLSSIGENKRGEDVKKAEKILNFKANIERNKKTFYNSNRFTDLELFNSSFHLFAKKKRRALLQSKALTKNTTKNNPKAIKLRDDSKKYVIYQNAYSLSLLALAKARIKSLNRNSSKSRIKNRCIETGRAHSVLRFCKLSRICLRENASKGLISGISKASW